MAFRERDVVRALGLTPRQEARIKELQESSIARHCDQFSPKGPPHEDWKSHEQERDNLLGQILRELTDEQQTRWKKLTGEPFAGPPFPGPPFSGIGRGARGRHHFEPPPDRIRD